MVKWLQGGVELYLPTDQALPQELVNAFFQAQDSLVLGTLTPRGCLCGDSKSSGGVQGATQIRAFIVQRLAFGVWRSAKLGAS